MGKHVQTASYLKMSFSTIMHTSNIVKVDNNIIILLLDYTIPILLITNSNMALESWKKSVKIFFLQWLISVYACFRLKTGEGENEN